MNESVPYRSLMQSVVRAEARPMHKHGHQPRLYELSKQIGAGMAYDDDIVFAAVWLHDLGVFEGNRPSNPDELAEWNHVAYAVRRVCEILSHSDFPQEKIQRVIQAIEEHQPGDEPTSLEAVIVRDADILEQLGAIAVMRTAAKLGSDTRFLLFSNATDSLRRQMEQLPAKLRLDRSKELAVPRLKILGGFLDALDAEAGPYLD